jgi:hypothetical protein
MSALAFNTARGFRPHRQPFTGNRTVAILAESIPTFGHSLHGMFDLKLVAGKDLRKQVRRIAALDRTRPFQIVKRANQIQISCT